jgi:hypothetical protein
LLFQEVIRSHCPEYEQAIPKSPKFPSYWGPCDSFCRERLHPNELLPQKGHREVKEIQRNVMRTMPKMKLLSKRLLDELQIGIDHQVFWDKMLKEMT